MMYHMTIELKRQHNTPFIDKYGKVQCLEYEQLINLPKCDSLKKVRIFNVSLYNPPLDFIHHVLTAIKVMENVCEIHIMNDDQSTEPFTMTNEECEELANILYYRPLVEEVHIYTYLDPLFVQQCFNNTYVTDLRVNNTSVQLRPIEKREFKINYRPPKIEYTYLIICNDVEQLKLIPKMRKMEKIGRLECHAERQESCDVWFPHIITAIQSLPKLGTLVLQGKYWPEYVSTISTNNVEQLGEVLVISSTQNLIIRDIYVDLPTIRHFFDETHLKYLEIIDNPKFPTRDPHYYDPKVENEDWSPIVLPPFDKREHRIKSKTKSAMKR